MTEYQFTNQFFEEGNIAFREGKNVTECPYDYLKYDDQKQIVYEHYRQREWLSGWRSSFENPHFEEESSNKNIG